LKAPFRACSYRQANAALEANVQIATANALPGVKGTEGRKRAPFNSRIAWLSAACLLLLVADGRNTIALAAWLAPMCLLRFVRLEPRLRGLAVAYLALALLRGIAYRGMTPIPGVFYLIYVVISGVSALIPYVADRLIAPRLRGFATTLVFPCALVTAQFIYSHGPQGSWERWPIPRPIIFRFCNCCRSQAFGESRF
jgi:hypothetical protein